MESILDAINEWIKEILIGAINGNLSTMFGDVNEKVGTIAAEVGQTPQGWNANIFSMIQTLSENVIVPIAGLVITYVLCYELISMVTEKNNMHEVDVANLYKWMFKTACAILILSNTFNIVMAVFDVSQSVIAQAGGLIQGSTDVSADMLAELETSLEAMDLGPLFGALAAVCAHWIYDEGDGDYHFRFGVWQDAGNLSADQSGPHPRCYAFQPGAWRHRTELHQVPVYRGLSRAADSCMCCNLRGAHSRHRNKRRSHWGDLGNCGLHGSALLHAL